MPTPGIDSRNWTGEIQTGASDTIDSLPWWIERRPTRRRKMDDPRACIAPSILILCGASVRWLPVTSGPLAGDLLIAAPYKAPLFAVPLVLGMCLLWLAMKNVAPRLSARVAMVAIVLWVIGMGAFVGAAGAARSHATAATPQRAQVIRLRVGRHNHFGPVTATLLLDDGRVVETGEFPDRDYGSGGRCFSVRRVVGPFGFEWLRLGEGSPLPGRGQLAWDIRREDCFSAKSLRELGH